MTSFDDNNDGVIDAKEAVDVAEDIAKKTAAEREAQTEATRERKISQVFRRFAMVLVLALLASVGINAGLTAAVVYAVKDTEVDGVLLVSSDTGDVLKVRSNRCRRAAVGGPGGLLVAASGECGARARREVAQPGRGVGARVAGGRHGEMRCAAVAGNAV